MKPEMRWRPLRFTTIRRSDPQTAELCIVPVYEGELDRVRVDCPELFDKARAQDFTGKSGRVELVRPHMTVCLLGLGKRREDSHSTRQHMHIGALCVRHALKTRASRLQIVMHASSGERALIMLGNFTLGGNLALPPDTLKTKDVKPRQLELVELAFYSDDGSDPLYAEEGASHSIDSAATIVEQAIERAHTVRRARWWVDLPSNLKTPFMFEQLIHREFSEAVEGLTADRRKLVDLEVKWEPQLRELGMELILAVGGCYQPDHKVPDSLRPRLLHFCRRADAPNGEKAIAILGKGVIFDCGGLNLKPGDAMRHMKLDMAAAGILALMRRLARMVGLTRDIHFIVPLVENGVGPGAMRPGDVYTSMNGMTVEIANTDAEGRLILADALAYAVKVGVDTILDLATLTGAQLIAYSDTAALFSNDEELAARVLTAAFEAGEAMHPMPTDDRMVPRNKSDIADIANLATSREAGAITAALFLREFVPDGVSWVHMDIAGPAWCGHKPAFAFLNEGATGFGVLTVARYIEKYCCA